jgi:hypothetical protein
MKVESRTLRRGMDRSRVGVSVLVGTGKAFRRWLGLTLGRITGCPARHSPLEGGEASPGVKVPRLNEVTVQGDSTKHCDVDKLVSIAVTGGVESTTGEGDVTSVTVPFEFHKAPFRLVDGWVE